MPEAAPGPARPKPHSAVLAAPYAGLTSQAQGLAERAGLTPAVHALVPAAPWRWLAPAAWPAPISALRLDPGVMPPLLIGAGGAAAAAIAAFRRRGHMAVQVQNPRMALRRFDLVVANHHDEISGPNVVTIRTALHRLTPAALAGAREYWQPRIGLLPRPLLAVLVGGSNGRYRLDPPVAAGLAAQVAGLLEGGVGVAITPSRRTDPAVMHTLSEKLAPLGAWIWDGEGPNPYLGMLALADAILVTQDSVSMVSEAVATAVPVFVAPLPGRSRRIGAFLDILRREGRIRWFDGSLALWQAAPLDDTPLAAEALRRVAGF